MKSHWKDQEINHAADRETQPRHYAKILRHFLRELTKVKVLLHIATLQAVYQTKQTPTGS